jgi:DNA-binding beta-propeller fold protein YncE
VRGRAVLCAAVAALVMGAAPARAEGPAPTSGPAPALRGLAPEAILFEHLYDGGFAGPEAVFLEPHSGELYMADRVTNLIGIFSAAGVPLFTFGDARIHEPRSIAVDRAGTIYVVDNDSSRVKRYSYRGEFLSFLELVDHKTDKKPDFTAITVDRAGDLYLADSANGEVLVLAPGGRIRMRLHGGATEFSTVTGLATDERLIYVADQEGFAIQVFDRVGRFLRAWGEHQAGKANVSLPHGIAVDARGRVVLIDTLRQEIKVFQPTGQLIEIFGGLGRGPGQVLYPTGVTCDATGRVYVADPGNQRVQLLKAIDAPEPVREKDPPVDAPEPGREDGPPVDAPEPAREGEPIAAGAPTH